MKAHQEQSLDENILNEGGAPNQQNTVKTENTTDSAAKSSSLVDEISEDDEMQTQSPYQDIQVNQSRQSKNQKKSQKKIREQNEFVYSKQIQKQKEKEILKEAQEIAARKSRVSTGPLQSQENQNEIPENPKVVGNLGQGENKYRYQSQNTEEELNYQRATSSQENVGPSTSMPLAYAQDQIHMQRTSDPVDQRQLLQQEQDLMDRETNMMMAPTIDPEQEDQDGLLIDYVGASREKWVNDLGSDKSSQFNERSNLQVDFGHRSVHELTNITKQMSELDKTMVTSKLITPQQEQIDQNVQETGEDLRNSAPYMTERNAMNMGLGQMEEEEEFFEPLSYKKLLKIIEMHHPVDPETKEKFSSSERITVRDYAAKLSDACFCYAVGQMIGKAKKILKKKLRGDKKVKWERPESMHDLPESGSSSDSSEQEVGARGLTQAAQSLGDGATMYLQSVKTFAIMFIVLTIINIPIFMIYQSTTAANNEFTKVNQFFKYFTIGNLGRSDQECGYSNVKEIMIDDYEGDSPIISLECPGKGYIKKVVQFGLLYAEDKRTRQPSLGYSQCHAVKNPLAPPIIIFNEDDILNDQKIHAALTTDSQNEWGGTRRQLQENLVKKEDEEPKIGENTANREKTSRDIRLYFENYEDQTTLINVNEQDTIRSLLEKVQLDIEIDQIAIFHKNQKLDLDKTVWDYNLQDQHKIVEKMKINVQSLSGEIFTVFVMATDTIRQLKIRLYKLDKTQDIEELKLFLDGEKYLQDYDTIDSLKFKSTQTIIDMATIQFILSNGTQVQIFVQSDTTFQQVKDAALKKPGVETVSDDLYIGGLEGTKLDLTKKVVDYKIIHDTKVEEYIKVFVIEQETNEKIALMVRLSDTVDDLEALIFEKTELNRQEQLLTFEGTYLNESDKLLKYKLKYGSEIELSTKVKVKLLRKPLEAVTIHISNTKKVKDLKALIIRDYGIPLEKLILQLGDVVLEDDSVLDSLVYEKDDMIHQIVDPKLECRTECIDEGFDYCVDFSKPGSEGRCCSDESCRKGLICSNTKNQSIPIQFKYMTCENDIETCGDNTILQPQFGTKGEMRQIGFTKESKANQCAFRVEDHSTNSEIHEMWVQINALQNMDLMIYEVVDGKYEYYRPDRGIIRGMGYNVRSGHAMFIYIERIDKEKDAEVIIESYVQLAPIDNKAEAYKNHPQYLLSQNLTAYNIDSQCNKDNIWAESGDNITYKEKFFQVVKDKCLKNNSCEIQPDKDFLPLKLKYMIREECFDRIKYLNITSMEYILVVDCNQDEVTVPVINQKVHKAQVGIIVVILDVISVAIMAFVFSKLREINDEYLEIVDDLRVQMKDFGVILNDVKPDRFTQDSRIQKMKIWLHFSTMFKTFLEKNPDDEIAKANQVIDVTLSLYKEQGTQLVFRMQEIQIEINDIKNNIYAGVYTEEEYTEKSEELRLLMGKLKRLSDKYKQINHKGDPTVVNTQRLPKSQRLSCIQYIFVTFKSCETNEWCLMQMEKKGGFQKFVEGLFKQQDRTTKQQRLMGQELEVVPIIEPDEIIWENLAYTGDEQLIRTIIMKIVAIFFVLLTTLLTMYISGFALLAEQSIPDLACTPGVKTTKKDAFRDTTLANDALGLMGCYCTQDVPVWKFWTLLLHDFADAQADGPVGGLVQEEVEVDYTNYCLIWYLRQLLKQVVLFIVATSAVLINGVIADIFKILGQYQKKHTKIEEQSSSFRQIFNMEFINMGIIFLFISMDPWKTTDKLMLGTVTSKEVVDDYVPTWYMGTGKSICLFLFVSAFMTNAKECLVFIHIILKRFKDRSYKMYMKLDPEDEDDDMPNTKTKIQSDLENLYTGKEFQGEQAFSRMMSTLFVIQMYGSGMPIMYFIGAVFYSLTYLVNKLLIIKFYKKSRTLTRTIPIFSMEFLKYGLLLHMANACWMLTNPEIFEVKEGGDQYNLFNSYAEDLKSKGAQYGAELEQVAFLQKVLNRFQFFHQQLYLFILIAFFVIFIAGKSLYQCCSLIAMLMVMLAQLMFKKLIICFQATYLKYKDFKNKLKRQVAVQGEEQAEDVDAKNSDDSSNFVENLNMLESPEEERLRLLQEEEEAKALEEENRKKLIKKRMERFDYSENILIEFNMENLSNFYERATRELEDFRQLFRTNGPFPDYMIKDLLHPDTLHMDDANPKKKNHVMRDVFNELCYKYRVTQHQVIDYHDQLIRRQADIEEVIQRHFKIIKSTVRQNFEEKLDKERKKRMQAGIQLTVDEQIQEKKNEEEILRSHPDLQFDNPQIYDYIKKIKTLIALEEDLIKNDKARKDNRRGIQEICRMTGSLSQSYFIFDSQQYKVGRKIYYGLDEDDAPKDDGDFIEQLDNKKKANTETKAKNVEWTATKQAYSEVDSEEGEDFTDRKSKRSKSSKRSARSRGGRSTGKKQKQGV